jgi:hypothetical protein
VTAVIAAAAAAAGTSLGTCRGGCSLLGYVELLDEHLQQQYYHHGSYTLTLDDNPARNQVRRD